MDSSSIQHPASSIRLDSHQHFWRYSAAQYPWIPAGSALQRDWLPVDLAELQRPLGFDGSIAVQARQSLAESNWLLGLADADPRIKGVVGWVDLQVDRVEDSLAELAAHPKFVGVRHVVQDEPDDRFLLRPAFLRGVSLLKQFGLRYDILIYPKQLPAALEFVRQFPEQPFVLDHIAKPFIRDGTLSPWREQIRELAQFPNVCCKVSGMVTEAKHVGWTPADFRPYLDVVFAAFGEDRLMFGSDWPVCLLAGSYEQVFRLAEDYVVNVARYSSAAQAKFFGGNCAKFYGVD
jgi:L-fuconolactonase